jgi:chromosome segregation ATPase
MAEMRAFMKLQQQSIEALKTELAAANDDIEQLNTNIEQLSEDNRELRYQLKGCFELVGRAIYGDNTVDENEPAEDENKAAEDENEPDQFDVEVDELLDMPLKTASVAVEDGLEIPQVVRCYTIQREDEDACIFSLNKIPRCLSPIPRLSSRTEPLTLVDIVLKNPEKAIASRDFCGNS